MHDTSPTAQSRPPFLWILPVLAAGVLLLLWLQHGHALDWDELEFSRASAWVAGGRVPYRDFWEHHTPLQWALAAPFTGHGPGVAAILALRWAQLVLWIPALWAVKSFMNSEKLDARFQWAALGLLAAAPFFFIKALEFRVEGPATALLATGWGLWAARGRTRGRAALAGTCFALAVLANLRMAPAAAFALGLSLLLDPARRRWGFGTPALWSLGGAGAVGCLWGVYLAFTRSAGAFWLHVITENRLAGIKMLKQSTLGPLERAFLGPFLQLDPVTVVFGILALLGLALALRDLKRAGGMQFLALLQVVHLAVTMKMGILYVYHFQTTLFLSLPLAALALQRIGEWIRTPGPRERWPREVLLLVWLAVAYDGWCLGWRSTAATLRYQDEIMKSVDARTLPGEKVFDGCGYALRRDPAYERWFLPILVDVLTREGMMADYTPEQARRDPPAAVVFNLRVRNWLARRPALALHLVRHYVPLNSNLWLPAPNGVLGGTVRERSWTIPRTARYRLLAAPALADHPWFHNPLQVLGYAGEERPGATFRPGDYLWPARADLAMTLDGAPWDPAGAAVPLRKGSILTIRNTGQERIGVLVLPDVADAWFLPSTAASGLDGQFILGMGENHGS